jgi:hypothetical protein
MVRTYMIKIAAQKLTLSGVPSTKIKDIWFNGDTATNSGLRLTAACQIEFIIIRLRSRTNENPLIYWELLLEFVLIITIIEAKMYSVSALFTWISKNITQLEEQSGSARIGAEVVGTSFAWG